jgi:hypothetical protein
LPLNQSQILSNSDVSYKHVRESSFQFCDLLEFGDSLNHFLLDLLLQFWLVQMVNAFEILLTLVDLCNDLVEEVIELRLQFFLRFLVLFFFLNIKQHTRGLE